ncbi:TIGR01777 family oxidoreductase [Nakamurella leprariae]|uniref:TIGR01777 family oxidoreductase n=1 Tax=Nakamurella leprariae TaxID=2803911 RepID=A0A938YEV1_9ACTN|nr:TIGR01777 family oxidoreductase [Nakamurella leprariae]MBM9467137.1 TIGR01777 family oxidoreductase [Nakamurella leprariae]
MKVVSAGSSGFLGIHLTDHLRAAGHQVHRLVRRAPSGDDELRWDPDTGTLSAAARRAMADADAVVNLCGAGVGAHRWTDAYRRTIRSSRVGPTALLARVCAEEGVPTLLNASGTGYYGDRGASPMPETETPGATFLAGVCVDWEAATAPAATAGTRVVLLRQAPVLGRGGDLLDRLSLIVRLGLGGPIAGGRQFLPWISLRDHLAVVGFLLEADVAGPVNLAAPETVTNARFVRALGAVLHRPTPWPVPGIALRVALGGFAEEITGGQRAVPDVLTGAGFRFADPELRGALEWALGQS